MYAAAKGRCWFVMVIGWGPRDAGRLALAAQFEPTSPSMLRSMTRSPP